MNTIDAYKKAIKTKFEIEKTGKFSEYLLEATPAKLKKLSALLFEIKQNSIDEGIFRKFFNWNETEDKIKQIKRFDTDKFRPFQNFLIRNTDISNIESVNLIAVLVDFHPRPYLKFRNKDFVLNEEISELTTTEELGTTAIKPIYIEGFDVVKKFPLKKKVLLSLVAVLIIASLGFSIKSICFPNKNGMVWSNDHYEAVEFEKMSSTKDIVPIDEKVLDNFRKITVYDTTTFFKNGNIDKPLVWYGKDPKTREHEYFNQPGTHPVTGKILKPITKYIIQKYIVKK